MNERQDLRDYFEGVQREGLNPCATPERFRFYCDFVFDGVDFSGKSVLDIGGGSGVYSYYSALRGATSALCLDPEGAGSSSGVVERFQRLQELLKRPEVRFGAEAFQDWDPQGQRFDVVLMHASINHLDEEGCIHLHRDPGARQRYAKVFEKLAAISRPGASLVVVDCSRRNLFGDLGLTSPFAPTIEWQKHQRPSSGRSCWRRPASARPAFAGIANALGPLGSALLGNRLGSYLTTSLFCLTMTRQ